MKSLYSQKVDLSPKVEFFSIPNSAINSEEISDIKVDSEGYVWIVSFKGLYRYDGERFQKISANYNSFGSLIRFYEGNNRERLVIDYWGAIYFVDNDSLFEYSHNPTIRSYYKAYGYSDIKYIDSALHFSYHASSYKICKEGKIIDPLADRGVEFDGMAVRLRKDGSPFIFLGNEPNPNNEDSTSFYIFDDNFKVVDSIKMKYRNFYNPTSLVSDSTYLLSTGKGNLIEFDKKSVKRVIQYPDQIINLFVDNAHNLWISTRGEGIHFYKNGKIDYENRKVILPKSTSIVSTQDYQGGIWLYSQEKGIGYISHPNIKFFERKAKVKPLVEALIAIKDKIIFAYGEELEIISTTEPIEVGNYSNIGKQVMRLSYDKRNNRLWVSARQGLFYLEGEDNLTSVKLSEEFSGSFSYLNSDWDDSTISLIGTNGYQYFICKDDSISYISERYEHKLKGVLKLKDTFYVNTGNGIYVKSTDTAYYLGDKHKIAKKSASQVMLLGGRLIFTIPSEGVYLFDGKDFNAVEYNKKVIPATKLIKEDDSTFWAISHYGCFKVTFQSSVDSIIVRAFSALPRMVLKTAAIKNNILYLQTRNSGIGVIELNEIINSQLASPKLLITKVQTKNKNYFGRYDEIAPISYSDNNIQISFKSLNFHDLDVSYRYKLNGSDKEWTTTITGFVNYVSLAPNNYTFEVQSRYGLGKWSESKILDFKIIPPIWQEWWFIILISLALLIIIYQSINYRFRIINREKSLTIGRLTAEQKALRAKMDPHFMFNVISSLQYLILRKKNDTATLFLNKFSKLLRNTLNQSDKEYITIKEEIRFVTEYIELEKMRLENAFDYSIIVPESINQSNKIPTFIIQPFIENSIQHGLKAKTEKGFLQLEFSVEGKFLKVVITDNGIGYNASLKNKNKVKKYVSHGIHTIKERLVIYNERSSKEDISVIDLNEEDKETTGTRVVVYLKLNQQ